MNSRPYTSTAPRPTLPTGESDSLSPHGLLTVAPEGRSTEGYVARTPGGLLLEAALMIAMLGAFTGGLTFFLHPFPTAGLLPREGVSVLTTGVWAGAFVFALLLWGRAFYRAGRTGAISPERIFASGAVPAAALVALYVSDLCLRGHGLFTAVPLAIWIPLCGIIAVIALAAHSSTARGAVSTGLRAAATPRLLCALSVAVTAVVYCATVHGKLLFGDDHPPFLYRLLLLRENFPYLPLYNTDWNAGLSAREFFAAGMMNVFFLALPFLPFLDPGDLSTLSLYSYLVGYLFILVVPGAIWAAARTLRFTRAEAAIAAVLALAPSLSLTQYAFKYGTIGFVLTSGLVPLALAANIRLFLLDDRRTIRAAVLTGILTGLATTWLPMAIAFAPLGVAAAMIVASRRGKGILAGALVAAAVLIINGWAIKTLFVDVKMDRFLTASTLPGSNTGHLHAAQRKEMAADNPSVANRLYSAPKRLLDNLQDQARRANPLLLVLLLPAFFTPWTTRSAVTSRFALARTVYLATIAWLMLLTAVMPEWKPQLELNRLFLPALYLLCLPAAHFLCTRAGEQRASGMKAKSVIITAILGGAVLLSPVSAAYCYANRSSERITFAPEGLDRFAAMLADASGPAKGRVFFLGFILHELGAAAWDTQDGGHVALLPALAKVPMYASHFYHVYWSTVDPIPADFRARGREGIEQFLDLVNASSVVTFSREWVRYCREDARYRELAQFGRFRVFSRSSDNAGYFLRGSGQVENGAPEGLKLLPASDEVVLKFRYHPRLRTTAPDAELFSVPVFEEDKGGNVRDPVSYIGVRVKGPRAPGEWIKIGFHPERMK